MDRLSQHGRGVQDEPPKDWPELGPEPSEADRRWWSEENESRDADDEPPDTYWDEKAGESEALDFLELGIRIF